MQQIDGQNVTFNKTIESVPLAGGGEARVEIISIIGEDEGNVNSTRSIQSMVGIEACWAGGVSMLSTRQPPQWVGLVVGGTI